MCALSATSCDNGSETKVEEISAAPVEITDSSIDAASDQERIPETLDEAVAMIMEGLTQDDREWIIAGGEEYEWTLPSSYSGMGMRNGWGLWGDSPLSRHFSRMGIYHADDMSGIVCQVVSRKVRKVPVELDGIVKYYRDYWAEQDIVSPLDLSCPDCGKGMVMKYEHDNVSPEHPERIYFSGRCPDGPTFLYYHKDGWVPKPKISEQGADDQLPVRAESKAE